MHSGYVQKALAECQCYTGQLGMKPEHRPISSIWKAQSHVFTVTLMKMCNSQDEVQITHADLHFILQLTRKRGRASPLSPLWLGLHSVTLTHFSKMQPPVEPSRLPANRSYSGREEGGKRKSGRTREGERTREAQTLATCYPCHILRKYDV